MPGEDLIHHIDLKLPLLVLPAIQQLDFWLVQRSWGEGLPVP